MEENFVSITQNLAMKYCQIVFIKYVHIYAFDISNKSRNEILCEMKLPEPSCLKLSSYVPKFNFNAGFIAVQF